jgi:ABC-type multidrug transport system fused ATPase/permease subunit
MIFKDPHIQKTIELLKEPKKLYWGMLAAVVSAGMTALIPLIYGRSIDIAVQPESDLLFIIGLLVLWFILSLVADGLSRYSVRQSYEVAMDLTNRLLVKIFRHLNDLPIKFHKEMKMGKIMRRVDRGVEDLSNMIEKSLFAFFPSVISCVVAIAILFFVEWRLASILTVSSLVYVWITFVYTKNIVKKQKEMHRGWEKAYGDLWDSVLNVQAVKAAVAEEFEEKRNLKNFIAAGGVYIKWRNIWQEMAMWQKIVFSLGFVSVFGLGIIMLRSGELSAGNLVMFFGYINLLTVPLTQLADQYRMIKSGMFSFRRAMKYYDYPEEKDVSRPVVIESLSGSVEFENVDFGYKKNKLVLRDISFKVEPGESVAFVGESGVGKSTVVDMIGRYYLPIKGRILIDGVDIKRLQLKALREQMAVVPQEILLFNDTIKNNIRYGKPKATDEEIEAAAKAASADEFIETFPRKYNQMVGERGIKLSGGQKQRLAIARAILRNPKILILDEATSALDSASEKMVQAALADLIRGRTTFIIAHRLSTIQKADKIIVLEKGKIAEMGTHEELMRDPDGIYRNFWELQTAIGKVS